MIPGAFELECMMAKSKHAPLEDWQGDMPRWLVKAGGREFIVYAETRECAQSLFAGTLGMQVDTIEPDINKPGLLVKDRWQ